MEDIYDKTFNGTDIKTGRPMSTGHPDGAWIISILYSFGLVASAATLLLNFDKDLGHHFSIRIVGILGMTALLFSVVFLFKRSEKALFSLSFLTAASIIASIVVLNGGDVKDSYPYMVGTAMHCYICVYAFGLKKYGFLK